MKLKDLCFFFEEYENYKPDINKMDKQISVNVISNCRDK